MSQTCACGEKEKVRRHFGFALGSILKTRVCFGVFLMVCGDTCISVEKEKGHAERLAFQYSLRNTQLKPSELIEANRFRRGRLDAFPPA